jgi:hypothetical protein
MARKQRELPGTRSDHGPKEPEPIAAIDDEISNLDKLEGKRTRIGQNITDAKKKIQALLVEHNLPFYEYEDGNGVLRKKFRKESLGSCKVKTEKRTDSANDDGEDDA